VGSTTCHFNTGAFAVPAIGTFGASGRDAFRSAPCWDLASSAFRKFPLWEFRREAFNLFNTIIFGQPGNDISNTASFGGVTSAGNSARQLQFTLRLIF
jgi:hypothetical protein